MPRGKIKFWRQDKGFGFLTRKDGGGDVFFHATQLARINIMDPQPGDVFSFEVQPNPRVGRPQAVKLAFLGRARGRAA
jgi:CspA family cold shock protein